MSPSTVPPMVTTPAELVVFMVPPIRLLAPILIAAVPVIFATIVLDAPAFRAAPRIMFKLAALPPKFILLPVLVVNKPLNWMVVGKVVIDSMSLFWSVKAPQVYLLLTSGPVQPDGKLRVEKDVLAKT